MLSHDLPPYAVDGSIYGEEVTGGEKEKTWANTTAG